MFNHLAIDWGLFRSGLAFGNPVTGLVIPYNQDLATDNLLQILDKEIQSRGIQTIVLGIPTNFRLQKTEITDKVEEFKNTLIKTFPNLKVKTINERGTTKQAINSHQLKKNKSQINHLSAASILTEYFRLQSMTNIKVLKK